MKIDCSACSKTYNFKDDKLPLTAFSFRCKQCGETVQVSQKKLDAVEARNSDTQRSKKPWKKSKSRPKEAAADSENTENKRKLPSLDAKALKEPLQKGAALVARKTLGLTARILGKSERELVFWLTQTLAYACIALLLLLAAMGAFTFFSIGKSSSISFQDVEKSLEAKEDPLVSIQEVVPEVKIPQAVERQFRGQHKKPLVEWLSGLNDAQRRDFVENLEVVIHKAQKEDPEHLQKYINEYKNLKFQKIVDNPAEKYFAVLLKVGLILCTLAVVAMIGLFSMLLVQIVVHKHQTQQS